MAMFNSKLLVYRRVIGKNTRMKSSLCPWPSQQKRRQDADHRDEIIAHWQERMAEEDWKHRDLMGFSAV